MTSPAVVAVALAAARCNGDHAGHDHLLDTFVTTPEDARAVIAEMTKLYDGLATGVRQATGIDPTEPLRVLGLDLAVAGPARFSRRD